MNGRLAVAGLLSKIGMPRLATTPAASANEAQWRSAPATPPRLAPSPTPTLVMKKLIDCTGASALDAGMSCVAAASST
jgi:hypothetical protein